MTQASTFSALHLSVKDMNVLRSLMSLAAGKTQHEWTLSAEDSVAGELGDVVLVDVDQPDGAALWPEVSQRRRPAVAFSRRRDFPARFVLNKPIRSQQLISLLTDLTLAVDDTVDEQRWNVLAFADDDSELPLAEHLRRHQWDQPVMIGGDYLPELIIDAGAGAWFTSASDRELARLLRRNFSRDEAQALSSMDLVDHTNGLEQQNLTNLKWRAGLALSAGALHPDLANDNIRFMLPQVPMQALSDTAYSRQARTLIRAPMSIDDLHEKSGAPKNDVAEFLNACYVCGFLLLDQA
ncbi:MAG: hypothetical protein AAGH65_02455 [Pseudomonadota bacterium]